MTLHRRSLRHTTWMILVVWLFALVAGVANACLLTEPNASSPLSLTAIQHEIPFAEFHHGEQADPGNDGCLKFAMKPLAITKVDQPMADTSPGVVGKLQQVWGPAMTLAIAAQVRVQVTRPMHLTSPIAARPHRSSLRRVPLHSGPALSLPARFLTSATLSPAAAAPLFIHTTPP